MGKTTGFLEYPRELPKKRSVAERLKDYGEVYHDFSAEKLRTQAARCMDCGIPFCHQGCPLGNLIPDWNDLVYRDRFRQAIDRLHATNNFPEFTGRLCPAPCEAACVLYINEPAVTIKQVEVSIVDRAWQEGWIVPQPAAHRSGKRIAIVGSGPAGLAAAQQLARVGHDVTVFERDDRIGGLLRYGIPDFKMHKSLLDRRLEQMQAEGVRFQPGVHVGKDVDGAALQKEFDAVCITIGSTIPRDLPVPGRDLAGVHFAMDYLTQQNRILAGDAIPAAERIDAAGKTVIILGGGDTGADCLGTAHRQGAKKVLQYEIMPRPPDGRNTETPWPLWPNIFRVSPAHEEGGERAFSVLTKRLIGKNGVLQALHGIEVEWVKTADGRRMQEKPGTHFEQEVDLLLLAMGFVGPEPGTLFEQLGIRRDERGNIIASSDMMTSTPGVFAAGDARRGQSLIVWAIAEGRRAAHHIDAYLMGSSELPYPVEPSEPAQRLHVAQ